MEQVCLFCCELAITGKSSQFENCQNDKRQLERFFTFLERFLGEGKLSSWKSFQNGNGNQEMTACDECANVLKMISELWHQLKTVELEIVGKMESLVKRMQTAERMPSRMHCAKRTLKAEDFRAFKDTRQQLIEKCSRAGSRLGPKVLLKRLEDPPVAPLPYPTVPLSELKMDYDSGEEQDFCDDALSLGSPLLSSGDPLELKIESEDPDIGFSTKKKHKSNPRRLKKTPLKSKPISVKTSKPSKKTNRTGNFFCRLCNLQLGNSYCSYVTHIRTCRHRRKVKQRSLQVLSKRRNRLLEDVSKGENPVPTSSMETSTVLAGSFSCHFCDSVLDNTTSLALHELEHGDGGKFQLKKYKCPRCFFRTNRQDLYVSHHLEIHLQLSDKPFFCEVCEERFKERRNMENHKKAFHGELNLENALHKCEECTAFFMKAGQLAKHQRTHRPIQCQVSNCHAKFKTAFELSEHEKLHSQFKCSVCDVEKNFAEDAALHELEHSPSDNDRFHCTRCPDTFSEIELFVRHFVAKHLVVNLPVYFELAKAQNEGVKVNQATDFQGYCCTICQFKLVSKRNLKRHHKTNHEIDGMDPSQVVKCDKCPAYFVNRRQLQDHHRIQHDLLVATQKEGRCDICQTNFKLEWQLEEHMKLHGKFACQFCGEEKTFANDLAIHEINEHASAKCDMDESNNSKKFQCPRCSRPAFIRKMEFVRHFCRQHLGLVPVTRSCPICGSTFNGKMALKVHINQTHRNAPSQEKLNCDLCAAYFAKVKQLWKHKRLVHNISTKQLISDSNGPVPEEKKKVICELCGKELQWVTLKWQHMRNVHGQGIGDGFKCDQCGKAFKSKGTLKSHLEYHHKGPDSFKYMCSFCPKKFWNKNRLDRHSRKHLKERPFACHVCDAAYSGIKNLRRHLRIKHGVVLPPQGKPGRKRKVEVNFDDEGNQGSSVKEEDSGM